MALENVFQTTPKHLCVNAVVDAELNWISSFDLHSGIPTYGVAYALRDKHVLDLHSPVEGYSVLGFNLNYAKVSRILIIIRRRRRRISSNARKSTASLLRKPLLNASRSAILLKNRRRERFGQREVGFRTWATMKETGSATRISEASEKRFVN